MDAETDAAVTAAFRPAKRRKFTRNRRASASEESEPQPVDTVSPEPNPGAVSVHVSDVVRLRKNKSRKNGIECSNTRTRSSEPPPSSTDLATDGGDGERLKAISDRFVTHSGQVVDVDKHMFVFPSIMQVSKEKVTETNKSRVAYIESEMARRRLGQAVTAPSNIMSNTHDLLDGEDPGPSDMPTSQRQPAGLGKIHEIDLGRAASLRNQQRTELAMRRARGEEVPPEEPVVVKKPRLGRNGKPRRGPKRRNSDDVKRDQLVEQVLHESRLEIYDEPEPDVQEDNLNADERIAEQFKRDFIDAMQARQRNRTAGQPKPPNLKPGEQVQRGPKLGGSRSARAAMREQQEKAAKK